MTFVPRTIKNPVPDVLSDTHDLTAHEELCRELEEQHDREDEMAGHDWPEDD